MSRKRFSAEQIIPKLRVGARERTNAGWIAGVRRGEPWRAAGLPGTHCALQVLIAAISVCAIRGRRITRAGACRVRTPVEASC